MMLPMPATVRRMIELKFIDKTLGRKLILSNVSLSVRSGEIVGIAGPVGAGKSTLLNILNGLITPDRGSVSVVRLPMSTHLQQILQLINYASSSQRLSGYATVLENLNTYARLYGVSDVQKHVTFFWNLFTIPPGLLHKKVYRLSSGENSLVNLVKALLNNPKVLLLDEITAHMDSLFAARVYAFIKMRRITGGVTMLVSQNTEELKQIATRMVVLSAGKIVYDGKPISSTRTQSYYA